MASLTESSPATEQNQQEEGRKNKIIDSVQSSKVLADEDSNKQQNLSSSTTATATTTPIGSGAELANGTISDSLMVVYDVEHLATFSTTGTCHETNNARSTNNGISRSKNNNNKSTTNATTTIPNATKTATKTSNGENSTLNEASSPGTTSSDDDNANNETTTPKVALQRLFELEKLSGIWTQRMQIELRDDFMLIIDCETNSTVERFHRKCVTRPEAFSQYNDIYNNIVVFIIEQQPNETTNKQTREPEQEELDGEIHIFQCVSHKAQQLVSDILNWKSSNKGPASKMITNKTEVGSKLQNGGRLVGKQNQEQVQQQQATSKQSQVRESETKKVEEKNLTKIGANNSNNANNANNANSKPVLVQVAAAGGPSAGANGIGGGENVPIVNVNVKETVQVFNQIAALREKGKSTSPTNHSRSAEASTPANPNQSATSASNSNGPAADRLPAAQLGSQLYKQRSIRATLAPKFAAEESRDQSDQRNRHKAPSGPETSKTAHITNNSSSCSSSDAAHSSSSSASYYNSSSNHQQQQQQQQQRHPTEISHNRDSDHAKKPPVATGARLAHQVSSSSGQLHKSGSSHKSARPHQQQQQRTQSDSSRSFASSSSQGQLEQVTTNESYVSVLNHCFDDIEKFIIRLQQAVAAIRELESKRKSSNRRSGQTDASNGSGRHHHHHHQQASPPQLSNVELALLQAKARGPNEDDYFEILSKFKLAFNLLAKLKGCIHEPNAPELVHFLFTPLAIIIESARNALPPIDPTLVGIPYLNQDALDLLSNCCTSKESDLWVSLGPNWTQTIDMSLLKASRLPSSFQPIFSDGWAPIISELELIGLMASPDDTQNAAISNNSNNKAKVATSADHYQPSDIRQRAYCADGQQVVLSAAKQASVDYSAERPQSHYAASGKPTNQVTGGKTRRNLQQSSRQHSMDQSTSDPYQRPYQASYGYMESQLNSTSIAGSEQSKQRHPGPEMCPSSRNSRGARTAAAGNKQYNLGARHQQDYLPVSESSLLDHQRYSAGPPAPPPPLIGNNSHHLLADEDTDLANQHLLHHSNQSDDYTELQEQYAMAGGHLRPGASSSSHYRNGEKLRHGHKSHNSRHANYAADHHYNLPPRTAGPFQQHGYETEYFNEVEHEAMLIDLGPAQTEWFYELQSRGALIVRVLFTREANNDKELSVCRGEILEVLDDSRKWWRARNIDLQVAHVPHTIVAIMQGYQTLDELLANNPASELLMSDDPNLINSNRYLMSGRVDDKRNSRNAGAFRYF